MKKLLLLPLILLMGCDKFEKLDYDTNKSIYKLCEQEYARAKTSSDSITIDVSFPTGDNSTGLQGALSCMRYRQLIKDYEKSHISSH